MASLAVILALLAPPAVVTGYGACGALNRSVCSCGDGCKATGGACSCLSCGSCSNCADGPHCNCVSCTCCHLHAQSYFGRPDKDEHSRDRDVEYVRTYDDDQHDELSGAHCGSLVATLEHELSVDRHPDHMIARRHYDSQQPIVMKRASKFALHQYFYDWTTHKASMHNDHQLWETGLINQRMQYWAQQLHAEDRDDFKLEKDKCQMMQFFVLNGLPMPEFLGAWASLPGFTRALQNREGSLANTSWPIYLKACHITQGSARSVRSLPSSAWVTEDWDELRRWIGTMWARRADDQGRAWTDASNALTDSLSPGFMLQGPAPGWLTTSGHNSGKMQVLELKVEVVWGRAYLALENSFHVLFLREADEDGCVDCDAPRPPPKCLRRDGTVSDPPKGSWWERILTEGHLQCAWDLAERAARQMAADAVRIDIFLNPTSPQGCMLNEISLSSAMNYQQNSAYLARLWLEPHLRRTSRGARTLTAT